MIKMDGREIFGIILIILGLLIGIPFGFLYSQNIYLLYVDYWITVGYFMGAFLGLLLFLAGAFILWQSSK
jgi:hypothetical protein